MAKTIRLFITSGLLLAVCVYSVNSAGHQERDVEYGLEPPPGVGSVTDHPGEVIKQATRDYPTLWLDNEGRNMYVDLSYPFNNKSQAYTETKPFKYDIDYEGYSLSVVNESYYLKLDSFSTSTHTGTHIDAPQHFNPNSWSIDQVPLTRLMGVAVNVVDLSDKVRKNRGYEFQASDFWGENIRPRSVVLVYTGVSDDYNSGRRAYYGMTEADTNKSCIPGFSSGAAKYLVSRGVYGVGLDGPSADNLEDVSIKDFQAHTIFSASNIYILENLNQNLRYLRRQVSGYRDIELFISPLAITNGTGSPVRVIVIQHRSRSVGSDFSTSSATGLSENISLFFLGVLFTSFSLCKFTKLSITI